MGTRSGSITFGGIASGIPTNEIIAQLISLERRPIEILQGKKADFQVRLDLFQDFANKARSLRDALRKIDNMNSLNSGASAFEEFNRFTSSSSNEAVLSAVATPTATPGSLTMRVDQRAQIDREVSQRYSALTDDVGTGDVTITVGSGTPVVVTIDGTNNTVEGLVGAINDSDADVRAFVLTDGDPSNPYRIVVQSSTTGADQAVALAVNLSGGTAPTFTETQSAQDAQIVLDPGAGEVTLTSSTNQFANVMPGLTVTAESVSAEVITIDVEQDAETMAESLSELVSTYNDIMDAIATQFTVDPATNRGGPLIGDSTLVTLKSRLSSVMASQITSGTGSINIASEIGLEIDREGKLSFDEEKFTAAVAADPEGVRTFFSGTGSLADQLAQAAAGLVDPVNGALVTRVNGTTESIRDIDDQIQRAEDRLEVIEANLIRQFSALEQRVSQIQQQGNFLAQFLLQGFS